MPLIRPVNEKGVLEMNWMKKRIDFFGERAAFIHNNHTYSYKDLFNKVSEWEARIVTINIKKGAVVAVICDFSIDSAALIIALLANENIFLPLTDETEVKHSRIFKLACIDWSFCCDKETKNWKVNQHSAFKPHFSILHLRNEKSPGLILFTSGTTGESKGAVLPSSSLLRRFVNATLDSSKGLRSIVFLKLDHIGGLNTLFSVIMTGGTAISIEERSPNSVCKTVEKHKVELLPTTPTFLNMMMISGAMDSFDLTSLKIITYGTEPMPLSTLQAVNKRLPDIKLKQTYGLTELGIFATRSKNSGSEWLEIGGKGTETRVVDEILQIKTESRMVAYLNAPSPFTEDGYYITGDKVEVNGSYFRILGRESDLINIGGEKVFPSEIESVLLEMPNVKEVLVTGKPNPVIGHIVCANFVLKNSETRVELANRMSEFCKKRLESFKIPRVILISQNSFMGDRLKKNRTQPTLEG